MKIKNNSYVKMCYDLIDTQGNIIESRTPENPIAFIVGHGQVLFGLEQKIMGQSEGFNDQIFLEKDQAHGDFREDLVTEVKRSKFPKDLQVSQGMKFQSVSPDGKPIGLTVIDVKDDMVVMDGNHPLAGKDLTFHIRILEVREAQKEELQDSQALKVLDPDKKVIH